MSLRFFVSRFFCYTQMNLQRYPWQLPPHKGSYLSQMGWAPEYIPQVANSRMQARNFKLTAFAHERMPLTHCVTNPWPCLRLHLYQQGYYTRKVLGHSAMSEANGQNQEGPQAQKQEPTSKETQATKRKVVYTPESASSGPSTPATPSAASTVTGEPNADDVEGSDGSEIVGHAATLYEPWSKIKRDPKLEPRQEQF